MEWKYVCLIKECFGEEKGYLLTAIRKEDIAHIREWRNEQMDVLRQKALISEQDQLAYFTHVIEPTFTQPHPRQILFSFLHTGICIGYGGLTNIDWENKRAEVSFLVNTKRAQEKETYAADYWHFLHLLAGIAFNELGFHRLFAETFAFREHHIHILETAGFKREGALREHVFKHNRWYDSIMHGLLAREYKNAQ
ncbi:GNAT family N-acetyltransferase [Candidatus Protochlamydia phocaeensis]|uniref:GNAT family N-acetyltransferase n=1 Tax=Candidatus Protochlamydia phocaeensis TaxID=1414722 RepID=UPI0008394EBA|nr:GNAT family N-acetyltransferase [Candidatus Protochlamydia phocaeensis]